MNDFTSTPDTLISVESDVLEEFLNMCKYDKLEYNLELTKEDSNGYVGFVDSTTRQIFHVWTTGFFAGESRGRAEGYDEGYLNGSGFYDK